MYSYPYTKEGISQALKEVCHTESPVVPESFHMIKIEGGFGGKVEGIYEFETVDSCKYTITAEGHEILILWEPLKVNFLKITSIQKQEI